MIAKSKRSIGHAELTVAQDYAHQSALDRLTSGSYNKPMRINPDNCTELLFSTSEAPLTGITTLPLDSVEFACEIIAARIVEADMSAGRSPYPDNMIHANRAQSLRKINSRLLDEYMPKPSDDEFAALLDHAS